MLSRKKYRSQSLLDPKQLLEGMNQRKTQPTIQHVKWKGVMRTYNWSLESHHASSKLYSTGWGKKIMHLATTKNIA